MKTLSVTSRSYLDFMPNSHQVSAVVAASALTQVSMLSIGISGDAWSE